MLELNLRVINSLIIMTHMVMAEWLARLARLQVLRVRRLRHCP